MFSVQVPPSFRDTNMTSDERPSSFSFVPTENKTYPSTPETRHTPVAPLSPDVLVFGSVAIDLACNFQPSKPSELSPRPNTSNPAAFGMSHSLLLKRPKEEDHV